MPFDTPNVNTICISDVSVELTPSSNKCIRSIDIRIDGEQVSAHWELRGSHESAHEGAVTLTPPRPLHSSLCIAVHLRYRSLSGYHLRSEEFLIGVQDLLVGQTGEQRKEWRKKYGKLWIVVGSTPGPTKLDKQMEMEMEVHEGISDVEQEPVDITTPLQPTTDDILNNCPSFRILVMGKTGVGKSSLINQTFGVTDAIVSHGEAGYAEIDREIPSRDNARFLLHDSKGFEHGDDTNVKIVQKFINDRNNKPHIKDKLHAIWLCIDVPVAGGRLLEKGIEEFLKMKTEGKLGKVPVIVAFTKYDLLVLREDRLMHPSLREGLSEDDISELVKQNASARMQKTCIEPFEKWVTGKVPYVTVSTEPGYEKSLSELVQLTYDHVHGYLEDASVLSAMAQRVSPKVNIRASIAVGRRRYWQRLAHSVDFTGRSLQECLAVIHADIVAVWHFDDPNDYMSSAQFKALMSNVAIYEPTVHHVNGPLASGISLIAGAAGLVSAVAGPVLPIVIPLAIFTLAKWVFDLYQRTNTVVKYLMTYIIDLTLIMQNIFWLQALSNKGRPISRSLIKVAVHAYAQSNVKQSLHFKIEKHVKEQMTRLNIGPDITLNTIETLLAHHTIDTVSMLKQKGNIPQCDFSGPDEQWDVGWHRAVQTH